MYETRLSPAALTTGRALLEQCIYQDYLTSLLPVGDGAEAITRRCKLARVVAAERVDALGRTEQTLHTSAAYAIQRAMAYAEDYPDDIAQPGSGYR